MNTTRAKELINCLLAQISDYVEWDSKEAYFSWLTTEVGFSQKELDELNDTGLLPTPTCFVKNEER